MLVEERRQRVLDLVSKQGYASLNDLAQSFSKLGFKVSESTIRRDIDHLAGEKLLRKTHGGAVHVGNGGALPALEDRTGAQIEEKRAVARAAAARVRDGDSVLLDGGTTTLEVARLLVGRP